MKISFQKQLGNRLIGVEFFWLLTIDSRSPAIIVDHFIPELFYDHLMVKRGHVRCVDEIQKTEFDLPKQSLKTIYTHPLTLILSAPLTLFGARLSLNFAESYWEQDLGSNAFGEQRWVDSRVNNLFSFARQVTQTIQQNHKPKLAAPWFSSALQESAWLGSYSPRHKRRLYKSIFGVSRKEMLSIRNVHSFLDQTCDFSSESPAHHSLPKPRFVL